MLAVIIVEENGIKKLYLPEPWRGESILPDDNSNPFLPDVGCGYTSNTGYTYNKCYLLKNGVVKELKGQVIVGKLLYSNIIKKRKVFRDAQKELETGKIIADSLQDSLETSMIIQVNNVGPVIWSAPRPTIIPAEKIATPMDGVSIYSVNLPEKNRRMIAYRAKDYTSNNEILSLGKYAVYPAPFTPLIYRKGKRIWALTYAGTAYGEPQEYKVMHPLHPKVSITLPPGYYLIKAEEVDE